MRELVFELNYRPGWNPVADALIDHPEATVRSLSCHVTAEDLRRVDHIEGSTAALGELEEAYVSAEYFPDCLVTDDCGASSETRVLERTDGSRVIYCVWNRSERCTSIPHLALEHLGEGLLFETRQQGDRYTWRIVLAGGEAVGSFADALRTAVDGVGGIELLRLIDRAPGGAVDSYDSGELSETQRRALHAAVEHGYYETPRGIELSELAERLGVPRSTLSYRLRRAEAELAGRFVAADTSLDSFGADR